MKDNKVKIITGESGLINACDVFKHASMNRYTRHFYNNCAEEKIRYFPDGRAIPKKGCVWVSKLLKRTTISYGTADVVPRHLIHLFDVSAGWPTTVAPWALSKGNLRPLRSRWSNPPRWIQIGGGVVRDNYRDIYSNAGKKFLFWSGLCDRKSTFSTFQLHYQSKQRQAHRSPS